MNKLWISLTASVLVVAMSGCAAGQRREALREATQFETVDTDGNGVISRAEWDAMKTGLRSMKR